MGTRQITDMPSINPSRQNLGLAGFIECFAKRIWWRLDQAISRTYPRQKNEIHICVYRGGGLGDVILLEPVLEGYRQHFGNDARITMLLSHKWAELASYLHHVDDFLFLNHNRFQKDICYRWRFLRDFGKFGFTHFFDHSTARRLDFGDLLASISNAPIRVGFDAAADMPCEQMANAVFTHLVPDRKWVAHETERQADLLRALGAEFLLVQQPRLYPFSTIAADRHYFVVAPGASVAEKRWAPDRFAEVAKRIYSDTGWQPVITYAYGEESLVDAFRQTNPDVPWKEKSGTIDQLITLLSGAKLVLCNDSGPMHLATALNVPTVAIVHGAEWTGYVNYPFSAQNKKLEIIHQKDTSCFDCRWMCTRNHSKGHMVPCLDMVDVPTVLRVVNNLISEEFGLFVILSG